MVLDGKRLVTGILAVGVLLFLMALSASPTWAQVDTTTLTVNKTGDPGTVVQGENVTYTITVTNSGDATADLVTLTDTLPANFDFVSADSTNGTCVEAPATDPEDVACDLGPLATDETATVTIVATATASGTGTNTATADSPNAPEASDTATTTVVPDLAINKLDDADPVGTGDLLRYTLRVTNVGGACGKRSR